MPERTANQAVHSSFNVVGTLLCLTCTVLVARADSFTTSDVQLLTQQATVVCAQSGTTLTSCDATVGTFTGSAEATASFGSLGTSARSVVVNGLGFFNGTSEAFASFDDTFTIAGGPASGFLDFALSTSGSSDVICVDTTSIGCNPFGPAFTLLRINNGSVINVQLPNGVDFLDAIVPYSNSAATLDVDLETEVICGAPSSLVNGSTTCTAESNFFDTAKVTGVTILDANHGLVAGAIATSASGTDYNNVSTTAVPEPSSVILFGIALMVCGSTRKFGGKRDRATIQARVSRG